MPVTYKKIASVTVGAGGTSEITFSSIPSTYTDLVIKMSIRTNRTGDPSDGGLLKINGATTNRSARFLYGDGSSAVSGNSSSVWSLIQGNSGTASVFSNSEFYIPNYAGSTNKSFSSDGVAENNATLAYQGLGASLWSQTSAITSIGIVPSDGTNILQHSTAVLYGISKS